MLGDVTNTLLLFTHLPEAGSVLFLRKHSGQTFVLIYVGQANSRMLWTFWEKLADELNYGFEASLIDAPKFSRRHCMFVLVADWFSSHLSAANKYYQI